MTLGESLKGAHKPGERRGLVRRVERTIARYRLLEFDAPAARIYGRIAAHLAAQGQQVGFAGTAIAAIALTHNFVVVTANERHFDRVPGPRVEDWL